MRRNRGVWFVSLATASSLLGDQMLYAVLPTIYADLGLQPYHVGILLSANRVVRLVTNHLAERSSRRWSLAWLLAVALTVGAFLNLAYGTVTWFPGLLAARHRAQPNVRRAVAIRPAAGAPATISASLWYFG